MIRTSIGTMQVGSPWLARQWINSIPGISVTPGITQNNLTIRAGNRRPSFSSGQSALSSSSGGSTSGGGSAGGGSAGGGTGGSGSGGSGGDTGGDGGGFTYF